MAEAVTADGTPAVLKLVVPRDADTERPTRSRFCGCAGAQGCGAAA